MLRLAIETYNRLRYRLPARPRQVQIEITNRCNMDCPMCPREDLEIELEHMEWNTFTKVVDKLGNKEEVTLTGWGEPFLHPRVFDMIAYCRERGHRVLVTSNGLFPKSSLVDEILNSGIDVLTFSIDSVDGADGNVTDGHNNRKVYENIEAIARGRQSGGPQVRLQATLHADGENDLYDVIHYAARNGIKVVNVGRLDRKYAHNLRRPGQREEERIFEKAEAIARSRGVQLDWLQYGVSSGLVRFIYKILRKKLHRSGAYCLKTFDYAYVSREGNVTPCCLLPEVKMGDLLEKDMQTIWQSGRFDHFREHYRDTCGSCDLWVIDQVDAPEGWSDSPEAEHADPADHRALPAVTE